MLIGVYGLNIPDSTVPSVSVKLSHMDMLNSDFYTTFNWAWIISLFPTFYSYKKDKDVQHKRFSGEIMFTSNEWTSMYSNWISSQWAPRGETPWDLHLYNFCPVRRLVRLHNSNFFFPLVIFFIENIHNPPPPPHKWQQRSQGDGGGGSKRRQFPREWRVVTEVFFQVVWARLVSC